MMQSNDAVEVIRDRVAARWGEALACILGLSMMLLTSRNRVAIDCIKSTTDALAATPLHDGRAFGEAARRLKRILEALAETMTEIDQLTGGPCETTEHARSATNSLLACLTDIEILVGGTTSH